MTKKRLVLAAVLMICVLFLLSSCVPGHERFTAADPAGFFWGLWHGMIVWISFIISIFTSGDYTIYEVMNTGWPYNLGFLLGASSSVGGITGGIIRIVF